jgi:hypothetical protein
MGLAFVALGKLSDLAPQDFQVLAQLASDPWAHIRRLQVFLYTGEFPVLSRSRGRGSGFRLFSNSLPGSALMRFQFVHLALVQLRLGPLT